MIPHAIAPSRAHPLGLDLPERRVLVVDDVPEILDLVRELSRRIRTARVQVSVEANAARALERVEREAFDLVLSDFRMRELDGLDLLRAARARNPEGKRILMTGYQQVPVEVEKLRDAAVDAYLHKPLRTAELLHVIWRFIMDDADAIATHRASARAFEARAEGGYVTFQAHLAPWLLPHRPTAPTTGGAAGGG